MTDEAPKTQEQEPTVTSVEVLRDEFRKEFDTLKASFTEQLSQLQSENEALKNQNNDLQRALIRSATVPEQPAPVVKSESELYAEKIDALAKKTLERMCKQ